MPVAEWLSDILIMMGTLLGALSIVGFLRFPDLLSRMHAVTKADSLALGMITCGVALREWEFFLAVKLVLVWALVLVASSLNAYLVANDSLDAERQGGEEA